MKDDFQKVQKALINIYVTAKIRKKQDAENITEELLQEEEAKLKQTSLLTLIEYIKSSIDIIVTLKVEEQLALERLDTEEDNENAAKSYETLLRKEENEIRQHISIEYQMKLHSEKLADHIEDLEKENEALLKKIEAFQKNKKTEEKYTEELKNIKTILQSYEDKNQKLTISEKTLREKLLNKEKEIKYLEKKLLSKTSTSFLINLNKNNNNTSICSHSRSKSKISDDEKKDRQNSFIKKSPIPMEKMKLQEKIDKYKVLIDKKIQDISKHKTHRTSRDKSSCSNVSIQSKEKTIDNDLSIISKRNEELTQRLNNLTLKVIKNVERKNNTPLKKIPINKKSTVYNRKKENKVIASKLLKKTTSDIPIIINQSDMPCYNNINIYTNDHNNSSCSNSNNNNVNNNNGNHNSNHNKSLSQVNLRQYIFSKCGTSTISQNNSVNK